ncbi:MAG TPA: HEAT repeat domain-containing protein, partial [Polyangiaceae bacterium]|nr:HEAT repeat domain-containing protein [Polyangiaceae bacterium]
HLLTRLGGGGLDAQLIKDLERRPGPLALLLPIRVRGRTILVLYGDHGDADVDLTTIGDVISFAPLVATTLERLIVQRKRGRAEALVLGSLVPKPPKRAVMPGPEERAQALAAVLTPQRRPPPFSSAPPAGPLNALGPASAPPASAPPAPAPSAPPPSLPPVTEPLVSIPAPAAPVENTALLFSEPPPREISTPPSQARARPLAPMLGLSTTSSSSNPPRSIAEALARPVIPIGRISERPTDPASSKPNGPRSSGSLPPQAVDAGWGEISGASSPFARDERGTRPGVGSVRPHASSAETASVETAESPDVSITAAPSDEELPELAAESWTEESLSGVPLAPASRAAAHSARPLPAPHAENNRDLPTVIVDMAEDCKALLEQLLQGDASAGDRLVAAGAPAIAVLVAAFPGPIEVPSSRRATAGLARASDCGPVMRTLARIGQKAVPFLVVRTNDGDAEVRGYATRLLGEISGPESAHAIARRFFDGDPEVRRAAVAAARLLASSPDAIATLVAELGGTAEDRMRPTTVRLMACDTLAELRQAQAVPYLVRTLEDNPVDIVQSARRALVVLARQDFGTDAAAWQGWWRTASPRHRIEWLIDALTHQTAEIRRAAGDELKALTREYFGYYDDLPPAERAAAQRQYRHWWETRGKARFRG